MGGTFEEAADILGDTETIVRKHYAKWSARGRQARINDLLARLWNAKKSTEEVVMDSEAWVGGPGEIRTHDLFHAMEAV
jgi:hypothetical protein